MLGEIEEIEEAKFALSKSSRKSRALRKEDSAHGLALKSLNDLGLVHQVQRKLEEELAMHE